MTPFTALDAVAVPLPLAQCDTDQIVPARFLSRRRAEGYAEQLFHDLRFGVDGQINEAFVLNQPAYRDARILVADDNFGCGSSRESAVWALYDYGFRAVIAPSFGDIFFNNCSKNGLLAIVLPAERVARLRALCSDRPGTHLSIDLEKQYVLSGVHDADSDVASASADVPAAEVDRFAIAPLKKRLLLAGMDEISYTLTHDAELAAFQERYVTQYPWLA